MNFARATRTALHDFIGRHFWKLASTNKPPVNETLLVQDSEGNVWVDIFEKATGGWQGSWASAKPDAIGETPVSRVMYWARIMPLVP